MHEKDNAGEEWNDSVVQNVAEEGVVENEFENAASAENRCKESSKVLGIVNENTINDDIINTLPRSLTNIQTVPVVDSSTTFTDSSSALPVDNVINTVSTSTVESATSSGDIAITVETAEASKSVDTVSMSDATKASVLTLGDILVESFASSSAPQQILSTEASIGCQADLEQLSGADVTKLSTHGNKQRTTFYSNYHASFFLPFVIQKT